ncbi:MAG TPA: TIGR00730 family Rossman fold protein [Methyloceanibacter sp.]|nr:TIGR00730 family Rossman fold protein [Methyloceanibacter sp.]
MNETLIASGLQTICVYCGSGPGRNPAYAEAARDLGQRLAAARIGLVYGGGSLGLMGEVARSVLDHGGHVTGIIPGFLSEREHMLVEAQELIVVDDMHQRKQLMFVKSDAFVALPGGLGTLEEFVEQLTWSQLGRHRRPIVLANIEGFWNPLLALFESMMAESFIRPGLDLNLLVVDRVEEIIPAIERELALVPPRAAAEVSAKF